MRRSNASSSPTKRVADLQKQRLASLKLAFTVLSQRSSLVLLAFRVRMSGRRAEAELIFL